METIPICDADITYGERGVAKRVRVTVMVMVRDGVRVRDRLSRMWSVEG